MIKQKEFKGNFLINFMKKRRMDNLDLTVFFLMIIFIFIGFYYASKVSVPLFPTDNISMLLIALTIYFIFISYIIWRTHPDIIKKEGKVLYDGKQYSIRIPLIIIEELNIKKGEPFIIEFNTKTKEYYIRFKNK